VRPSGARGSDRGALEEGVSGPGRASWPVRALRIVAWSWFVAGLVGAAIIWLNSQETVTTTRTLTAHARLTFQDIETHVSAFRLSLGFVSALVGLTAWAVLLVICSIADPRLGSQREPG
jgi:hypothetical protein